MPAASMGNPEAPAPKITTICAATASGGLTSVRCRRAVCCAVSPLPYVMCSEVPSRRDGRSSARGRVATRTHGDCSRRSLNGLFACPELASSRPISARLSLSRLQLPRPLAAHLYRCTSPRLHHSHHTRIAASLHHGYLYSNTARRTRPHAGLPLQEHSPRTPRSEAKPRPVARKTASRQFSSDSTPSRLSSVSSPTRTSRVTCTAR